MAVQPHAVPEDEIELDFVRASGPGGQNVNKVSSKVRLRWNVGASRAFTDAEKAAIRQLAGRRLNGRDEVVLAAEHERSQAQNRADVTRRLQELVARACTPRKRRVPTRPSGTQKRLRLEEKRKIGERKRRRRPPQDE